MEEVVAKRHNAALAGYIIVVIIGLAMLILGCIVGVQMDEAGALVICIIVGVLITAMGVYSLVKFFMVPSDAIVYRDGVLYLPRNVTCRPEELERVFVKVFRSRYGAVSHYGKMEITVNGKVYKYNNIAQIKRAQDRLLALNKEAIERLSQPVQPSDDKAPENPFSV